MHVQMFRQNEKTHLKTSNRKTPRVKITLPTCVEGLTTIAFPMNKLLGSLSVESSVNQD